jgi:hypothetical protein
LCSAQFPLTPFVQCTYKDASAAADNSYKGQRSGAEFMMQQQFDQIQKFGQDNLDAVVKAFGAVSKGTQTIAVEVADYARKSFEQGTATLEKLVGAKTLDKAIEIQTDYLKSAYEGFVAQSTKIGELYTAVARDAFKPYEGLVAKPAGAK